MRKPSRLDLLDTLRRTARPDGTWNWTAAGKQHGVSKTTVRSWAAQYGLSASASGGRSASDVPLPVEPERKVPVDAWQDPVLAGLLDTDPEAEEARQMALEQRHRARRIREARLPISPEVEAAQRMAERSFTRHREVREARSLGDVLHLFFTVAVVVMLLALIVVAWYGFTHAATVNMFR